MFPLTHFKIELYFFPTHVHVTMEPLSYISIAGKLNQCHFFTYPPVCGSMLELIYILKCVIIILHFMIIRLSVIKTVPSINDKISEGYKHNFLTLLKVKGMNSISLFSPFLFFKKATSILLHCFALV